MAKLKQTILIAAISGAMGAMVVLVGVHLLQVHRADAQTIYETKKEAVPLKSVTPPPLPKPRFDSGWVNVEKDTCKTINHNLNISNDFLLVDVSTKEGPAGASASQIKGFPIGKEWFGISRDTYALGPPPYEFKTRYYGWYWKDLTSTSIKICRKKYGASYTKYRVRIWKHN